MDFKVNHASLANASAQLQSGSQKIESNLSEMDSQLQRLHANWEGNAQEAYLVAKARWTEGMNGMKEVLTQIGAMVEQANQSYMETDKRNASRFGG